IVARESSAPAAATVHRKREGDANTSRSTRWQSTLAAYLDIHQNDLRDALVAHLGQTAWPDPASGLPWAPGGARAFTAAVVRSVAETFGEGETLRALVHPGNLVERFKRYVTYYKANSPEFDQAAAQLIEWAVRDALIERVG